MDNNLADLNILTPVYWRNTSVYTAIFDAEHNMIVFGCISEKMEQRANFIVELINSATNKPRGTK